MNEPIWITLANVAVIHARQLALFGGQAGVRDEGMLRSALDRPRNKWAYGESDICTLAAAYAFGIAKNHPFIDGNKRAAFGVMALFLVKNGVRVTLPNPDVVRMMLQLAAGELSEAELAAWIAGTSRPG